ncbi:endonuclease domain-containing protein [Streptomyces sp. NPDC058657]|uniref:endonuclease domain-containing protein n=1 Tax=unclassified Streptomyces TaxID=2593676 RepID=UPI003665B202
MAGPRVNAVTSRRGWVHEPGECRVCEKLVYEDDRPPRRDLCLKCWPPFLQARRFGLSVARVNAILRVQNDYCPLCDDGPGDSAADGPIWWQVDHDHACCTGCPRCVRGLLCRPCNTDLGRYEKRLRQGRLRWPVPKVDAYLATPPARSAQARKPHADDLGWARVRYTALSFKTLTWKPPQADTH